MRFGLVGTSWWAQHAHAAGIQAAADAELGGVWGRDPAKAQKLADELGCRAYATFDELLDDVEAVSFSVPPDVQADLAKRAAQAGKHVMLDKPVSLSVLAAADLEKAVIAAGVASLVFFTGCYTPERREWVTALSKRGPWRGGTALWLAAAFAEGSPFDTPWRREQGALWDVGPHILAALIDALGPVEEVLSAARGSADLVHFTLRHEGGATSTVSATLQASPEVSRAQLQVWGDVSMSELPHSDQPVHETFAVAVTELMAAASSGAPHPCDVAFGRRVVEILADVESALFSG